MAKVSCNYINKIAEMKIESLNKPIVFVVDMINGFITEGNLSDRNILEIVPAIKSFLERVHPSVFICDAHDLNAREFNSFAIHCIKNTRESKVIDDLQKYVNKVFYKNSTNAYFAKGMDVYLKEEIDHYQDIIIVGCCSDICILQFALTLNTYFNEHEMQDKRIIVPINMIETYDSKGVHEAMHYNEMACDLMLANGITVIEMK